MTNNAPDYEDNLAFEPAKTAGTMETITKDGKAVRKENKMKIHDNTDAPKVNGYILGDQNHIGFYFKGYVYYFGFSSSKAYPRKTHLQNWCKKWVYLNEMCAEKKEEYMETMGGISDIEPDVFSEMKIEEMGDENTDIEVLATCDYKELYRLREENKQMFDLLEMVARGITFNCDTEDVIRITSAVKRFCISKRESEGK